MSVMDQAIDYVLQRAHERRLEVEVLAQERASTAVSYASRKLDQFSVSETRQLGVRLINGQHEGVAYTESLERESLDETLTAAEANARMIKREWIADLHSPTQLPELAGIYNPSLDEVPVERKLEAAADLERVALDYDSRITNVAYARYGDSRQQSWIANTKGLRGSYKTNACYAFARCLAKDGDAAVMGGDFEAHRGFNELNTSAIARTAAAKTLERIGAERPATGRYTVVFENRVAETLVGLMSGYFSAKAVDEKTSPLAGKLGQKLFSAQIHLTDDPFYTTGGGTRPFDDEGYPSQKTVLIEDGILRSYLTNSVLAKKMKLQHTASGARAPSTDLDVSPSNLLVRSGNSTLESLLCADSKVIFITDLMGHAGFRATSGDFSLPVEGHLFENGKRTLPLKDFLISGNILQLFANIEGVANDIRIPTGSAVSPSLLVRDLNVAGKQG